MANLKNHPGKTLRADAAASLERLEAQHGVITVNSAERTEAEQNELIHRYFVVGGAANRPPNLYAPARPATASKHVGGKAFDTPNIAHMLKYGPENGWFQNFAYDPVHFEYDPTRDQHAGGSTGGAISHANQTVKNEQNFLNQARGEKLTVDGVAGAATVAAFKRYQTFLKKYGYKGAIDGKWGSGTQAAHSAYYAAWKGAQSKPAASSKRPTIRKGSTGTNVSDLQKILNKNYPAYSKLKVDGVFGPAVEATVKEFQKRVKVTPDGIVGPTTWAKLGQ